MINKFSIENFKVFNQKTEFEFAPITILTGPNNSGKSSLTKGLAALLNAQKKDIFKGIYLHSPIVPLGDFDLIKNNSSKEKFIKMSLQIKEANPLEMTFTFINGSLFFPFAVVEKLEIVNNGEFVIVFENAVGGGGIYDVTINIDNSLDYFNKNKKDDFCRLNKILIDNKIKIGNLKFFSFTRNLSERMGFTESVIFGLIDIFDNNTKKIKDERNKAVFEGIVLPHLVNLKNKRLRDETITLIENLLFNINSLVSNKLKGLHFEAHDSTYSPINRGSTKRKFQFFSDDTLIERIINQRINSQVNERLVNDEIIDGVESEFHKKWLTYFNIGEEIVLKKLEDSYYNVLLKNCKEELIPICDLGHGVAGLIALIMSISEFRFHGIRIIEEPETNLHPKFQSLLADLFNGIINDEKNQQLIIETHSEYMIRKFQYLVAIGKMKPEDIVVYYFHDPNNIPDGEPYIKKITIGNDGRLSSPFGPGFFDETDRLLNGLITGELV